VEHLFDADVAWFVEFDKAPSKVLAHHYPGVPNYGDVTTVDWASVEPVDILTGGFPCQDVSLAGARKGLQDGTRSGLWSEYAKAIDILRPSLVVIENVRGLLSAKTMEEVDETDSDLEWFEAGVGEPSGGDRPVLNAFGRVLGDLAELGYDADWVGVRASDAGAPHGRFRVFILAHADGAGRSEYGRPIAVRAEQSAAEHDRAHADADPTNLGHERSRSARAGRSGLANNSELASDASGDGFGWGAQLGEHAREPSTEEARPLSGHELADHHGVQPATDWGPYDPAIHRWEQVLGRPAPAPVRNDGRDGSPRLNPELTEWMMGWPDGWVTSPEIGLTRNEQLKACGNGVVTQQAFLALSVLTQRVEVAA